ncbi:putative Myosin heavy chain, muscle [Hypsibius exemplaris]|nr:putative Myosin heavy chain, muscle [Hypsibius exemplaris]
MDGDGVWNEEEMQEFQERCYNTPLLPQAMEEVRNCIAKHLPHGVKETGITLDGYLYLNMISSTAADKKRRGRKLQPAIHKAEISTQGTHYLLCLFSKFDRDQDDLLSDSEFQNLLSVSSKRMIGQDWYQSVETDAKFALTRRGFISLFQLTAYFNPVYTADILAHFGYSYQMAEPDLNSAFDVHKDAPWEANKSSKEQPRKVILCNVIGNRGAGKTSFRKASSAVTSREPREEQAETDGTGVRREVGHLCGINPQQLIIAITKPKVKVGTEVVTKGCVGYCRFEIFDSNGFEQICINFTNEKVAAILQPSHVRAGTGGVQTRRHRMGVHRFRSGPQACIELIEKPLGIFSILEEESMFPKATDDTFNESVFYSSPWFSVFCSHLKFLLAPNFSSPGPDRKELRELTCPLPITPELCPTTLPAGWRRNKDPLNDNVVELFKKAGNPLLPKVFSDPEADAAAAEGVARVARATHPHFVRCIIPNEMKQPGVVDAHLVMHQLTCNGVLEGIRICRKGFPNRMVFSDFKQR